MSDSWTIERHFDGVDALHGLGIPAEPTRAIRWCVPERSAVVLGSAQPIEHIDVAAAEQLGIDVVRRRSGGGAVLVEPGDIAWVDVLIPRDDPLWCDDVGRAFWWLGEVWRDALDALGHAGAVVHRGALITTEWSRLVCFAGLGPGEVTIDGRKVVGISQRRTRQGAVFQCAVVRRFALDRLVAVLALAPEERRRLVAAVAPTVGAVPDVDPVVLADTLEEKLRLHEGSGTATHP